MISYQLYSSRNFLPVEHTLALIAKHGCTECEGVAHFIIDHKNTQRTTQNIHALKRALSANNLSMPTLHIMIDHLQHTPDALLQCADILGCHTFVIAYVMPDDRPATAQGWQDLARAVQSHAKPLTDKGVNIAWHNHDFEFTPLEGGRYPLAEIFKGFPKIQWEADVAWIHIAKVDPIDKIKKYSDRLCAVHVKDIAPDGQNQAQDGWCNIGEGVVDWVAILTAIRQHTAVQHFILEHDNPVSDVAFVSASAPYLSDILAKIKQ